VTLTEGGVRHVEAMLLAGQMMVENSSLYDIDNVSLVHHVNRRFALTHFLRATWITSSRTTRSSSSTNSPGAMMEGRRYSEGLHQALEAKEKVTIQNENQTLRRSRSRIISACIPTFGHDRQPP